MRNKSSTRNFQTAAPSLISQLLNFGVIARVYFRSLNQITCCIIDLIEPADKSPSYTFRAKSGYTCQRRQFSVLEYSVGHESFQRHGQKCVAL